MAQVRKWLVTAAVGLGALGLSACAVSSSAGHPAAAPSTASRSTSTTPAATTPTPTQTSAAHPVNATSTEPAAIGGPAAPRAAALVRYVRAGRPVAVAGYQRGTYASGQPMRATPGIAEFTTPSGNIACGIVGPGSIAQVSCSVARFSYPTPAKPATCHLNYAPGWVSLDSRGVTRAQCLGGPPFAPVSRTLPYGTTLRQGSFACRSGSAYLACVDLRTGHGFTVNRTTLRTS
jgi:hypothetical protein